ncbi:MAG: hypothetical protein KAH20_08655, partial [Methylococcales bacterium]|nr:hypothetical protein [Methylococcales bacterium]
NDLTALSVKNFSHPRMLAHTSDWQISLSLRFPDFQRGWRVPSKWLRGESVFMTRDAYIFLR